MEETKTEIGRQRADMVKVAAHRRGSGVIALLVKRMGKA